MKKCDFTIFISYLNSRSLKSSEKERQTYLPFPNPIHPPRFPDKIIPNSLKTSVFPTFIPQNNVAMNTRQTDLQPLLDLIEHPYFTQNLTHTGRWSE